MHAAGRLAVDQRQVPAAADAERRDVVGAGVDGDQHAAVVAERDGALRAEAGARARRRRCGRWRPASASRPDHGRAGARRCPWASSSGCRRRRRVAIAVPANSRAKPAARGAAARNVTFIWGSLLGSGVRLSRQVVAACRRCYSDFENSMSDAGSGMRERSSASPVAGKITTDSRPAAISAALVAASMTPRSRPIAVAATMNGSEVACSRPAIAALRVPSRRAVEQRGQRRGRPAARRGRPGP